MKFHILYPLLAAKLAIAAPPPTKTADVCGITTAAAQASFSGQFKIQAQRYDFSGQPVPINVDVADGGFIYDNTPEGEPQKGLTFTLKNNKLQTKAGVAVKLGLTVPKGQLILFPSVSKKTDLKQLPFEIQPICDTVANKTVLAIDIPPNFKNSGRGYYLNGVSTTAYHGRVFINDGKKYLSQRLVLLVVPLNT